VNRPPEDAPPFAEPWQAQAFALTLGLHAQGLFSWGEWAAALGEAIKRAQAAGDPDTGERYWHHWLDALETLSLARGAVGRKELGERIEAWDRAVRATPHGQPIELRR